MEPLFQIDTKRWNSFGSYVIPFGFLLGLSFCFIRKPYLSVCLFFYRIDDRSTSFIGHRFVFVGRQPNSTVRDCNEVRSKKPAAAQVSEETYHASVPGNVDIALCSLNFNLTHHWFSGRVTDRRQFGSCPLRNQDCPAVSVPSERRCYINHSGWHSAPVR